MSFKFTSDDAAGDDLVLVCDDCGDHVCTIEDGDDLEIIVRTATDHAEDVHADA